MNSGFIFVHKNILSLQRGNPRVLATSTLDFGDRVAGRGLKIHGYYGVMEGYRTTEQAAIRILSVNAFHEKAGRSQVSSFLVLLDKVFPLRPS
jgi:hypothetical protein